MRIIVMGTGPFAVPSFRALMDSRHQVLALVTRPITDPGRRKDSANPMRDAAVSVNIPVQAPEDVNDREFVAWLREQQADLFVVCDFGQVLSSDCLTAARLGGINLHGSLLPKYRGAAPIHWAVYRGDPTTGVTVIHMTPRLDAGPILAKIETPIEPNETTDVLEARLSLLGAEATLAAMNLLQQWDGLSPLGVPQDPQLASRAPRLRKEQGLIDWSKSAQQIGNQIRAFTPWPGSFTNIPRATGQSQRIIVQEAIVEPVAKAQAPGTVLESGAGRLVISCGEQSLSLLRVQPAGKRSMAIAEFLRGYPIQAGVRLE